MSLLERFLKGDIRALSRIITFVENRQDGYRQLLGRIYPRTGAALRIGITGPPGAGKSTLVDTLTHYFLNDNKKVGIVAVDPTSPFTGGALLGDRVRMGEFPVDSCVYFRSMATRGATGGLAGATDNVALCYDAFGFDITLIETVGVGQVELDIVDNCDAVVVVLVPESGDAVQTLKAGLLEVADLFCINKADRPGADRMVSDLQQSLEMKTHGVRQWRPPVILTEALNQVNIDKLYVQIGLFIESQRKSGEFEEQRRQRVRKKVLSILRHSFQREFLEQVTARMEFDRVVDDIIAGKSDPFREADQLYSEFGGQ